MMRLSDVLYPSHQTLDAEHYSTPRESGRDANQYRTPPRSTQETEPYHPKTPSTHQTPSTSLDDAGRNTATDKSCIYSQEPHGRLNESCNLMASPIPPDVFMEQITALTRRYVPLRPKIEPYGLKTSSILQQIVSGKHPTIQAKSDCHTLLDRRDHHAHNLHERSSVIVLSSDNESDESDDGFLHEGDKDTEQDEGGAHTLSDEGGAHTLSDDGGAHTLPDEGGVHTLPGEGDGNTVPFDSDRDTASDECDSRTGLNEGSTHIILDDVNGNTVPFDSSRDSASDAGNSDTNIHERGNHNILNESVYGATIGPSRSQKRRTTQQDNTDLQRQKRLKSSEAQACDALDTRATPLSSHLDNDSENLYLN
ncbi:unnamed protein product [Clonostachys chloroleuca]|uniref:Uncharacterized protein n=1 Tax=Clonostachys chloroleuca TaxID=1926264 RepID=A0AA35LTQ4_9HYPO|nr:unnamed protein product [Clonostachys chloroleuca]